VRIEEIGGESKTYINESSSSYLILYLVFFSPFEYGLSRSIVLWLLVNFEEEKEMVGEISWPNVLNLCVQYKDFAEK
jgi:hypothetical protein